MDPWDIVLWKLNVPLRFFSRIYHIRLYHRRLYHGRLPHAETRRRCGHQKQEEQVRPGPLSVRFQLPAKVSHLFVDGLHVHGKLGLHVHGKVLHQFQRAVVVQPLIWVFPRAMLLNLSNGVTKVDHLVLHLARMRDWLRGVLRQLKEMLQVLLVLPSKHFLQVNPRNLRFQPRIDCFCGRRQRGWLGEAEGKEHLLFCGKRQEKKRPAFRAAFDSQKKEGIERKRMKALSLFSGCGGLDLGVEQAGFEHLASVERMDVCVQTLRHNRPDWNVLHSDVRSVDFTQWKGQVDLLHGGPPCQPFSSMGKGLGRDDERNMWPELLRAVAECTPKCVLAENVTGLLYPRFADFVEKDIEIPLRNLGYSIQWHKVSATRAGVPQRRNRVFLVAFLDASRRFELPPPLPCRGVRETLGLGPEFEDGFAPTIKSAFTGPRGGTGVSTGTISKNQWVSLGLWPSGVQQTRERADSYPVRDDPSISRMCLDDIMRLQGFPLTWHLCGGTMTNKLGQLGNSVSPPVAKMMAEAVMKALA